MPRSLAKSSDLRNWGSRLRHVQKLGVTKDWLLDVFLGLSWGPPQDGPRGAGSPFNNACLSTSELPVRLRRPRNMGMSAALFYDVFFKRRVSPETSSKNGHVEICCENFVFQAWGTRMRHPFKQWDGARAVLRPLVLKSNYRCRRPREIEMPR